MRDERVTKREKWKVQGMWACVRVLSSASVYDALSRGVEAFSSPSAVLTGELGTERGSNNRDISSRWLLIRRDNARRPSATVYRRRKAPLARARMHGSLCARGQDLTAVCVLVCVCVCVCVYACSREKARAFICLLAGPSINNAAIRYKNEKKGWKGPAGI